MHKLWRIEPQIAVRIAFKWLFKVFLHLFLALKASEDGEWLAAAALHQLRRPPELLGGAPGAAEGGAGGEDRLGDAALRPRRPLRINI